MSSERPLAVLITNLKLSGRTGSEILTRNIALSLRRRGHRPIVYSPVHGPLVEELRSASIPVADDIRAITRDVDIIHGHHHPTTAAAAARFRDRPAIFLSQDFQQWHDVPPKLPNIRRHLVVSEALFDRLTVECGVPRESVELLLNPVDTHRFRPGPALQDKPRRAALFAKGRAYVDAVREACRSRGLQLEVFGKAVGRLTDTPEEVMPQFDIVFGSGLTALEAMSCGRATVVCDARGLGGMCTTERFARFRALNFGLRVLDQPLTAEAIGREIDRYDAADAQRVSEQLRAEANIDSYTDRLVHTYRTVITEFGRAPIAEAEWSKALSAHLQDWAPRAHAGWPWVLERDALLERVAELEAPVTPVHAGQRYSFKTDETRPWMRKLNGLGRTEPGGTWTIAPRATLLLSLGRRPTGPTLIDLVLKPFLAEAAPTRDMDVIANGERIAECRFAWPSPRVHTVRLEIPADVVGSGGEIWLVLKLLNAQSPRELGINADGRQLGVNLQSLTVLPPPAEETPPAG